MPRPHPSLVARALVTATAAASVAVAVALPAVAATPSRPVVTAAPSAVTAPAVAAVATASVPVRPVAVRLPAAAVARSSAMEHALDKVGARYRWGAAGPNAFDCSGLVYWSYRQTGLTLPRTSRAMSRIGTPVARDDLEPGDLVFFYRPVSHVAIYVGNGEVVHASTSGRPVKLSRLDELPFTTARRV